MKISKKTLNEIAQSLEAGMKIFINKETYEFKEILDFEDSFLGDYNQEKEIQEIEQQWKSYTIISKMESFEAFKIMEDFVEEIPAPKLKEQLIKILNRRSPFANFKAEIDESDYREKWFSFRTNQHIEYLKSHLTAEDIAFEN